MHRTLTVLLIPGLLAAQTPPPAPAPAAQAQAQAAPVIKVTTRLVQVSLVAHDKKGQPVADLKKEDFTLYDKGQEQPIKLFSMETSKPAADAAAEAAKPLPAGVVSNRNWTAKGLQENRSLPNAVTVILLDGLNSRFQDQHAAKTGQSWQLDASTATDAATGDDNLDDFLNAAEDKVNNFYKARRIETTLAALATIADHLAGMAGRKNLIWLSGGFPLFVGLNDDGSVGPDFQNYGDQLQSTLRELTEVSIAIYPVDARGLMGPTDTTPSTSAANRTVTRGGRMVMPGQTRGDQRARNNILDTQGVMHEVADRTGGRAFINTNDISGAIRSAVNDTEVSYTLGYSPSHNEWNGEFREIKIKVNRPGVEIRYRKGYYALPENPSDDKIRRTAVAAAANSPLLSTGLGLAAKVAPPAPGADLNAAKLTLMVIAKDVNFALDEKNLWAADLDVLMVVRDSQSKALHDLSRTIHLGLKPEQYDLFQKNGINVTMTIETPPASANVRAVVRDLATGRVGSLDIPLH